MTNKKIHLAKSGWLILLCIGIISLSANHSQAIPLTGTYITYGGPIANGWYTEYSLFANEFGPSGALVDAFCVENVPANSSIAYELIPAPNNNAAQLASQYFNNSSYGFSKAATQIAIWELLFPTFNYTGSLLVEVQSILSNTYSLAGLIGLAHSPPGSVGTVPSQDYLVGVSVPDASIMLLLGSSLMGLAVFSRKSKRS